MMQEGFSIKARIRSFQFAFAGLRAFIQTQHNAWIHAAAAITVVALGIYCHLSPTEWMFIVVAITLVFVLELINTIIEALCNLITEAYSPQIKFIKDVAAAAVLISAFAAVVIGFIIFIPKFI
jgi:diacylglycerol kinase (ATP)